MAVVKSQVGIQREGGGVVFVALFMHKLHLNTLFVDRYRLTR